MIVGKFLSSFLYFGEYGPKNDPKFDRPKINLKCSPRHLDLWAIFTLLSPSLG